MMALFLFAMTASAFSLSSETPLEVSITGQPPYGYAVSRATTIAMEETAWFKQDPAYRLLKVLMPDDLARKRGIQAMAYLQDSTHAQKMREVPVFVNYQELSAQLPTRLLVSNMPEKVTVPRVLFEGLLTASQPARLLFHHVNYSSYSLTAAVELLNPSAQSVRVQIIDAEAGPSTQECEVGHRAALAFLDRESRNAGYLVSVPPSSKVTINRTAFPMGYTVSGLAQIRILSPGAQLVVRVNAQQRIADKGIIPLTDYTPLSIYGDYQYNTAQLYYRGTYTVDADWLFVPLGGLSMPAVRPGQELDGSYGVTHFYELTARNLTSGPAEIVLGVEAAAGAARLAYSLGGSWQETGVLHAGHEVTLTSFTLPPGTSRTIHLVTMPASGSYYPMRFSVHNRN